MGEEKNIDSLHVIDLSIYVFLSRVDARTKRAKEKFWSYEVYICPAIDLRVYLLRRWGEKDGCITEKDRKKNSRCRSVFLLRWEKEKKSIV